MAYLVCLPCCPPEQGTLQRVRFPGGPREPLNGVCFGNAVVPSVDNALLLPFQASCHGKG